MSKSAKLRVGVVGAGKIGTLRMRSIERSRSAALAAVFDPSPAAAARAKPFGAPVFTELAPFLDSGLDAVIVSSPVHVHREACLGAFQRGLHVLCEKPLANTVAGCRELVDAARAANCALGIGFNLRYFTCFDVVKRHIDDGRIGRLDHLRVFGGHEGVPKFTHKWEYVAPESGGGAMMDVGIHMSDLTRWLLGEITAVRGVMTEHVWKLPGSDDNAMALFTSPAGITATYHATWIEWKGYHISVEAYGDRGMVAGAYAPMSNTIVLQDSPGAPRRTTRLRYPAAIVREKLRTWQSTALTSFEQELADFVALCDGDTSVRIADGYDGLRSVEVADAVRRSTTSGERVELEALGRMPSVRR